MGYMNRIVICDDSQSLSAIANASNGLGYIQPLDGTVTEELNGQYEAEFTVSSLEPRFGELHVGGIVKLITNEDEAEQMFRIYEISLPINSKATVKACHITYDLGKVAVTPFTATGSTAVCSGLMSNALNLGDFTITSTLTNTTSVFTLDIPRYFRECLGGWDGSVLDTFRCEYIFDNLNVQMVAQRGSDNGVRIAYGKNLTDFKQDENNESVYTAVLGFAVYNDTTYTGNVYHKIVSSDPKIKIVDFSADYTDSAPTVADLTAKAQAYATANSIEIPKVNINVQFVPLAKTLEYKNIAPLEKVLLGDTVHVDFPTLNVSASARVVKTVWDLVKGRYASVELGSVKSTLSSIIADSETAIEQTGAVTESLSNQLSALQTAVSVIENKVVNHYRLSGNSSVYFNINNGQFMAVLFAQRYSASQTGAVCLLEQYSTHYTTLGSLGAVTVTKGTGRQFTIANTSSANVELVGLCGYFTAV